MKNFTNSNNNNSFSDLVLAFNLAVNLNHIGANVPEYTDILQKMGIACSLSVLKRVIDPTGTTAVKHTAVSDSGCNKALMKLRQDLARTAVLLENTFNASSVNDVAVLNSLIQQDCGDGYELVHTAIVALLEEIQSQKDREPDMLIDIERPYKTRRLKKHVYIREADTVGGYEDIETTPIQEVYRAIRRYINNTKAVQTDKRNGYTYLEDLYIDKETGEETNIYIRLPKYSDIGGRVVDFNGKEIVETTADETTAKEYLSLLNLLLSAKPEFTSRQRAVLEYRLQGYGYKAIATRFGVTQRAIAKTCEQIQKKAIAVGIKPKA